MTTQAHLFGAAGRTDDDQVLAELEVDYTPPAVAVQALLALRDHGFLGDDCRRVLDPAAGSGCWGRAARAVLGPVPYLVGVEPRLCEEGNIGNRAAYNMGHSLTLERFIEWRGERGWSRRAPFDLIATNPPFSAFESYWPTMLRDAGLVAPGGLVVLYGLTQWGQSAQGIANLRRWSPSMQFRCGGRIAHRENGKTDAREYSVWVWDVEDRQRPGRGRPRWSTEQLPELPLEMRRWSPSAVPGTYPIEPALVDEIRRRYL